MNLSSSVRRIVVASSHIVLLNSSELRRVPQISRSSTDPSSLNHFFAFTLDDSRDSFSKSYLMTSTAVMSSVRRYALTSATFSFQASLNCMGQDSSTISSRVVLVLYGSARRLFRGSRGAIDVSPPRFIDLLTQVGLVCKRDFYITI